MTNVIEQEPAGKIAQLNVRVPAELKRAAMSYTRQSGTTLVALIEKALREQLARTATATGGTK